MTDHQIEQLRAQIQHQADQVDYEPTHHRYATEGVVVPGVTKLIRPITDTELQGIPPDVLEAARQRGTMVHEAIDRYLSTGFDTSRGETASYMKQFKRFMKERSVIVLAHEVKVRNFVYGMAGRCDGVCMIDGQPFVRPGDWKVTFEIHPSVAIQLNMYESCLCSYNLTVDNEKVYVMEGFCLHLDLDGYTLKFGSEIADRELTERTAKGLINVNTFRDRYCKRK